MLSLEKINIITACDLDTISAVYFASKLKNVLNLFDAHEYFVEVPELQNRKFKKRIWKWIENFFVPRMDKCYTVNTSLAAIFYENLAVKFEIVENWPRFLSNETIFNTPKDIFLYQGVLNTGRGLIEMVKIMKYYPDYEFWIIGKGVLEQELKTVILQYKLDKQVKLLGFVLPKNLPRITAQAFIGINLLVSDSLNYYYSSANKFFDYIHGDLPSISMNYPEYKRINDRFKVSILIDDFKEESLIFAINQLMKDKVYTGFVTNCQLAKRQFNWSRNIPNLQKLYS